MRKNNTVSKHDHTVCWRTIDAIARKIGKSRSRLAIMAGKDPTALNQSKRIDHGFLRVPNITTILDILKAANMTWQDWASIWKYESDMYNNCHTKGN